MSTSYLKKYYQETVAPELMKSLGLKNIHEVPRLTKIVLNTGINSAADKTVFTDCVRDLSMITGQKAVLTKAKKAIANFKLRQGQPIGACVTLRGERMWEFLYRLISVSIPAIRDFRGLSSRLDGKGNYSIGISDCTIFPEISVETNRKPIGLDITIVTTAQTDHEGRELLRLLGMPFRRPEPARTAAA